MSRYQILGVRHQRLPSLGDHSVRLELGLDPAYICVRNPLDRFFNESAGYVVFPKVGEAAFVVGGAHGKGEVFEQTDMMGVAASIGIAKMTAVSVGLSLGGETFQEIIFFKSKDAFDKFKKGKFTMGADVKAVAVKAGAATKSVWNGDIAAFVRGQKGAMVDASDNGQHLKFESH